MSEGLSVLSGVVSDGASRAQACAGARLQPNLLRRRWWINAGAQRATAAGESSEHLSEEQMINKSNNSNSYTSEKKNGFLHILL